MDLNAHLYAIGLPGPRQEGSADAMGFKAWNLARLAAIGLPVPPAFVLGTPLCARHRADPAAFRPHLRTLLETQIERLEAVCGLEFGSERKPLLVSVRSSAAVSMPGMMDTVLDVGLTDATLRGLLRVTGNPRLAWDSYRRLIQQFAEVVHGAPAEPFQTLLHDAIAQAGVSRAQDLDFRDLSRLCRHYQDAYAQTVGQPFPQDPAQQLLDATAAVFDSWMSPRAVAYRRLQGLDDGLGTAITVQRMVFGNAGGTSGAGVGFTRDPASGENRLYLDFRFNAQGEDVVSGRHAAAENGRMALVLPSVLSRLQSVREILEREFGDVQEFEFTVQDGVLYLLQTRAAKRTDWAALRIAVDQVTAGAWSPATALRRLDGVDLPGIVQTRIEAAGTDRELATGTPASIGVASGVIALDAAAAERFAQTGTECILVRDETRSDDLAGIAAAQGVITAKGSRTAHAAVVARQLGKACLVGCNGLRVDLERRRVVFGTQSLHEGERITVDCGSGRVLAGAVRAFVERPDVWLDQVARWRAIAGPALVG